MNIKERFKKTIAYSWHYYVIAFAFCCVSFPLAFSFMHRVMPYEELNLFISCDLKDATLNDYLKKELNDLDILDFDVVTCNSKSSVYLNKLTSVGYTSSDIIIIPDNVFSYLNFPIAMQEIDSNIKANLNIQNCIFYDVDNKSFGVKLPSNSPIISYMNTEVGVNYYAFINGASYNIGDYSNKPITTDNAFKLLTYILGV